MVCGVTTYAEAAMSFKLRCGLAAGYTFILLNCQGCATWPPPSRPRVPGAAEQQQVLDEYLAQRIRTLRLGSPAFRAAFDSIGKRGLPIMIGTADQVMAVAPWAVSMTGSDRLAQLCARFDTISGAISAIVIQVDVKKAARHMWREVPPPSVWFSARARRERLDRFIEDLLIHELWGHLVPLAASGNMASSCKDPLPGQEDLDSCVMRRENQMRTELGRTARTSYVVARAW
jgi:hypothetical protein